MSDGKEDLGKGNDYFLGSDEIGKEPFTKSRPIRKNKRHTIGKLGNGILRPKKSYIKGGKDFAPKIYFGKTYKPQLTDTAKTQELVKQIEDSIQARIDKAKAATKQETEIEKSEKKPMNKKLKGGLIAGAIILVIAGIVYVSKKRSTKLKTA